MRGRSTKHQQQMIRLLWRISEKSAAFRRDRLSSDPPTCPTSCRGIAFLNVLLPLRSVTNGSVLIRK